MLDRDSGEREDRARCEDGDGALCCMLHSRIGIAFVRTGMLSESTLVYLARFHVVNVDSFAADEWRLDLGALRSGVPEIGRHACPEAVDPARMSLCDLYYATV